ncbi:hypothetical protein GCM10007036_45570 [Alsobacter metallidurans]|uniref:Uncharacterized protein n=1 Tax=Alsobacter metallidurans TaxID=340221 RepID=A0A917IBT3_9HYPH|nr:hypothetical protein [Alsobacter metallidurans]GGH33160.1 hypothetical protein GCM10007036_45570 [Alsobacter metallidurans]
MTERMRELAGEIVRLQAELDREIEARRKVLGWTVNERLVAFEHGIAMENRRLRVTVASFLAHSNVVKVVTAPVIYSLVLPIAMLDGCASLYQAVCFRAYAMPRVRRGDFVSLDRRHLSYLNWIEALNCLYCSYANGVIAYVREIGSRTEQYWCPIKHALRISDPHKRYYEFLEYGDAQGYRARLGEFRAALAAEAEPPPLSPAPSDARE